MVVFIETSQSCKEVRGEDSWRLRLQSVVAREMYFLRDGSCLGGILRKLVKEIN
jgi:hypothetical protein